MLENILLNQLKTAFEKNLDKVVLKNTFKIKLFLDVLKAEGFILGYTLQDDYLIALLKYNNSIPAIQNIKTFSKISTPYYVKSKKIIEMIKRNKNSIFLVRTSKGLLSNKDILTYKAGGILLARLQ